MDQQRHCRRAGRPLAIVRLVPDSARTLDASVLICTYNRADLLAKTLESLARSHGGNLRWDVIVVDNNSTDRTREVIASRIDGFPVPLRYLFEPRQGKSISLNTGLASTDAPLVVFTDDDVRLGPDWLQACCRPMLEDDRIDYTGGPVLPMWESTCPSWVDQTRHDLWGTLAILDYGPERFIFEERRRVPLGVNMAVRRRLIDRIGGFDPGLGRKGASLIGQEQAEFFCRSREIGARGMYEPAMALEHHVPAARLTRDYFRRWWFWKGFSKSRLEHRHRLTELGVDLTRVPTLFGVPRFMFGAAIRDVAGFVHAVFTLNAAEQMRRAMMLCYFGGYVKGVRDAMRDTPSRFYTTADNKQ